MSERTAPVGERVAYPSHHYFSLVSQLPGADTHDEPHLAGEKLQSLNILSALLRVSPVLLTVVFSAHLPLGPPHVDAPHDATPLVRNTDLGYGTRYA